MIKTNLQIVRENIARAAKESGREDSDIMLIAVSKTWPADKVQLAYDEGQTDFAENYVQEFLPKVDQLPQKLRWHFIGHLQSNKVKDLIGKCVLIHSIDSKSVLKEFEKRLQKVTVSQTQDVLLQVQFIKEESKSGVPLTQVSEYLEYIQTLKHIRLRGVMWMPPLNLQDPESKYQSFVRQVEKWKALVAPPHSLEVISMGTTHDYEAAIRSGSNMVRVGSAIFGERTKHD